MYFLSLHDLSVSANARRSILLVDRQTDARPADEEVVTKHSGISEQEQRNHGLGP